MCRLGVSLVVGLLPGAAALNSKYTPRRSCGVSLTFSDFVKRYSRDYEPGTDEYRQRERLFVERAQAVERHNCGQASSRLWRAGVNNLADWSEEALEALLGTPEDRRPARLTQPMNLMRQRPFMQSLEYKSTVPRDFSWANLSTMQEAKHQGHCGSCWALAAVTAMNAHAEIRGRQHGFSVSQIVACAPNPRHCGGSGGCHGATAELAFDYAMRVGLVQEEEMPYPFVGDVYSDEVNLQCPTNMALDPSPPEQVASDPGQWQLHHMGSQISKGASRMGLVGWTKLPENREEPIVRALVEHGPVKVSVATSRGWHHYSSGIMDPSGCDEMKVLKHAVILFGYGEDQGTDYWLLKNSWGPDWGEGGNMRLMRIANEEGDCGWDDFPEKGSGCRGGPQRVWVCGACGMINQASFPKFA